jgi:uncharacterized protein (DUF885 family)
MTLSPIFEFAEHFVDRQAALDPAIATAAGIPGYDHLLTDYSPTGYAARADHVRRSLTEVQSLPVTNDDDRRAKELISERFAATLAPYDVGEWMREMTPVFAPAGHLRATFDLMPRDGEEAWHNIAERMLAIPGALDGLRATYDEGRAAGVVAPLRQVLATVDQVSTWASKRWFDELADEAAVDATLPAALRDRICDGADSANAAYGSFGEYLRDEYAPGASPTDGCGPELYSLGVRLNLGADLNPQEMYEWAWSDFHELRTEIAATCARIRPGAGFGEVIELLESDPNRAIHGVEEFRDWLQQLTDTALAQCKQHFEIPAVMDRCEALIAPEGSSGAAFYTDPSEDFSRPGRTWYPTLGRTSFSTWGEVTTCYHESVPGHHLQIGYALTQAASLSRIQRSMFISGHGEGWALYAEQLADEFGWFENPDHRLGFLSGQMLRTVRIIIDIGMHLGMPIPAGTTLNDGTPFHAGELWNADLAFEFAVNETGATEDFMRTEIDRYLGWPAQAISYKIGQREWIAARDEAKARHGAAFDLKAWHTTALGLGAIGLGQLRAELAR